MGGEVFDVAVSERFRFFTFTLPEKAQTNSFRPLLEVVERYAT